MPSRRTTWLLYVIAIVVGITIGEVAKAYKRAHPPTVIYGYRCGGM